MDKTHGNARISTLTSRKEKALAALLTCPTVKEASAACGISLRVMWDYQKDPAFMEELRRRQADMLSGATRRAQAALSGAVDTLSNIAENEDINPSVRVTAAGKLIDSALRLTEVCDLERRVAALEAQNEQ